MRTVPQSISIGCKSIPCILTIALSVSALAQLGGIRRLQIIESNTALRAVPPIDGRCLVLDSNGHFEIETRTQWKLGAVAQRRNVAGLLDPAQQKSLLAIVEDPGFVSIPQFSDPVISAVNDSMVFVKAVIGRANGTTRQVGYATWSHTVEKQGKTETIRQEGATPEFSLEQDENKKKLAPLLSWFDGLMKSPDLRKVKSPSSICWLANK